MKGDDHIMAKIKKIKGKLGTQGKTKNPYLKFNGSLDLIEKFPSYKDKKERKKRR